MDRVYAKESSTVLLESKNGKYELCNAHTDLFYRNRQKAGASASAFSFLPKKVRKERKIIIFARFNAWHPVIAPVTDVAKQYRADR